MKTIETELRKYRVCRAEMDRTPGVLDCSGCPFNLPSEVFRRFVAVDHILKGEALP